MNESLIINNKYEILKEIGKGKFGVVYKGINKRTGEHIAIKISKAETQEKGRIFIPNAKDNSNAKEGVSTGGGTLVPRSETKILNYLYNEGCRNIPKLIWYGLFIERLCIIIPLYECSLYEYFINHAVSRRECEGLKKTIEESKINTIMYQCISIIESIHDLYVIHRDIKPDNFMLKGGVLYLVDFGLSTFYVNENKQHISIKENIEEITGTPKYISINIHNGVIPSRRDDLISLGYMYIFMICRELPWESLPTKKNEYNESHILNEKNQQRKMKKSLKHIEGIFEPIEKGGMLIKYIRETYNIEYHEDPSYNVLKEIFLERI
jgi:serine/threonine protein kinase